MLGSTLDCPTGTTIDLSKALPNKFRHGSVGPCPDNGVVCAGLACGAACSVGGTCSAGRCFCNLMFTGARGSAAAACAA